MGTSVSILLIAIGAILTWGVTADAEGLDVGNIGVILLIVGLLGLVLSLVFWSSWGGFSRRTAYVEGAPARRRVVEEPRTTTVVEEEVAPGPPPAAPPP